MSLLGKSSAILGINARNLLYISRFNSRANKKLADDKIFTKRFLQARGIGVAQPYALIKSLSELRNFNPKVLPQSFIIKPNKGYGGEGIIAIKGRKGDHYIDTANRKYSWSDLKQHCMSILDGRYAISGLRDYVIFEELLVSHEYFKKFIEGGLPDIRIIVFKYIPIIAMLRLPTPESEGKANLHLGAIGLGIDIGTGRTTFGVKHNSLLRKLPNGETIRSILIPQWDDILLTAAKTQYYTQIGYLAVDLALAKNGIKILELNARAGLAIQISNQALLRKRLDKVADLKVVAPAEGVKIGKTLFTRVAKETAITKPKTVKPVIGLYEHIAIINATNGNRLLAKIDPHAENNIIDTRIQLAPAGKLITVKIKNKKIKTPFITKDLHNEPYDVVLSGKFLTEFYIDTTKINKERPKQPVTESREEKILQNIDHKICSLNEKIHLIARLKPTNLMEEYKKFLKNNAYSPRFTYKKLDLDISLMRKELKKIPRQIDHYLMPLYIRKIEEIENKLSLIEHIGQSDFSDHAVQLYGSVDEKLFRQAEQFVQNEPRNQDTSKKLSLDKIITRINECLKQHTLLKWKIKILEQATSGMQINKNNTIFINKKAIITENRLRALIAHEIETHIFRLENGRLQKYRLFEQGSANYLLTEEGLAIYNQNQLDVPLGAKHFSPAFNIIAIHHGAELSFAELFKLLTTTYHLPKERAWRLCLRVKRGLENTGQGGTFTKDRLYFVGYKMIQRYLHQKGADEYKKLYIGKIGIEDLQYISDMNDWPVKYLPEHTA